MKKILCPTDYSIVAKNAVEFAANISKAIKADLVLYHMQSKVDEASEQYVKTRGVAVETANDYMIAMADETAKKHKIVCKAEVETASGSLAKAIGLKAVGYDLIIMGTNGPHDVVQYFTGSNTYNAVLNTNVPVIIVPEEANYKPLSSILFAFDYLHQPKVPMIQLMKFARLMDVHVTILQVLEKDPDKTTQKKLEDIQYSIKGEYENIAKLKFVSIAGENIAETIKTYVEQHPVDLLALCTIERNGLSNLFHDSVIKKLSAEADYPMLVFHH